MSLPLSYNWRNLLARRLSTSLTFTFVAAIVLVLSVLLSFAAGIRASLTASGSPQNVMVLKPGATAESTSIVTPEEVARLSQTPGVARSVVEGAETLLISPELCVQTSIPRRGPNGTPANVAVRGVDEVAYAVHPEVKLREGRHPAPGSLEVIIGVAARDRYADLRMGGRVLLGRSSHREYEVVGVFEAAGGALESEIWAHRTSITDSYHRRFVSSVVIRLDAPELATRAIAYLTSPSVGLEAKRETDYYMELASKTREIVVITTVLVGIMAVGAVFAVANTMYAAVDGRRKEIAMLRTIGFSRRSIMAAFVVESLMICIVACLFGLGASLLVSGSRQDFLSDTTWTVLAYELRITPGIVAAALGLTSVVGVVGALAPAMRAARTGMIEGLRKA